MHLYVSATKGKNLDLANELKSIAKEQNIEASVISLEDYPMPLYTPSEEEKGIPDNAHKLASELAKANAVIYCTPEYNGSVAPIVNNAIAWISRTSEDWRAAFNHKACAVATHSGGGGVHVNIALRDQLQFLGSVVMPRTLVTNYKKPLNPESAIDVIVHLDKISQNL